MRATKRIEGYVTQKGLCSGCGICASLYNDKVSLKMNKAGFYRPVFNSNLSDTELGKFVSICPALNMKYNDYKDGGSLSGKSIKSMVAWAKDEEIRYQSSSGGVVTAFLIYLMEHKIVDGVIHAIRTDNQFEARGGLSLTTGEIKANLGSLYMPVRMLDQIDELLDCVSRVAVVGKGCDIRALRRFIETNPGYKKKVVAYIGILCGGAPSIHGTQRILNSFRMKETEIKQFRYRGYGWPGYCTAITEDGKVSKMTYSDAWAKNLGPTSPLVCKVCFDGIAEAADISVGDAWICNDGNYPSFEEANGRNLVICRSERGVQLFEDAIRYCIELSNDIVDNKLFRLIQPSQSSRRYLAKYKIMGLRLIGYRYPVVNMKHLTQVSEMSGEKISTTMKIRTMMGSIKRALKGKERL